MPRKIKTKTYRRRKRRKKYSFSVVWRLFLLGIFLGLLVSYLIQINYTSSVAYKTQDLRNQIEELKEKKEELKFKVSQARSLEKISQKLNVLKMVATDKVDYLVFQRTMAKK